MSASFRMNRLAGRLNLDAPAQLMTPEGVVALACVRDVSQSGAFVETQTRTPLYSIVAVRSALVEGEWLKAYVVRKDESGMGLEWLDIGPHPLCAFLAVDRAAILAGPAGR